MKKQVVVLIIISILSLNLIIGGEFGDEGDTPDQELGQKYDDPEAASSAGSGSASDAQG